MSQEKATEIIDLNTSRGAAPGRPGIEKAGEFLANARNAAGLDLAAISAGTKVKIEHLEAIEQTRPDKLPATPYAVGFVKVYACFLGLDAEAVAAQFRDDIGAGAPAPVELTPLSASPEAAPEIGEGVRLASIFGILAVLIFAGWAAFGILGNKDAVIEEYRPALEPRLSAPPLPVPRDETAPELAETTPPAAVEKSVDTEIHGAAPIESPQSAADALLTEPDPNTQADVVPDQTSGLSSTLNIVTAPASASAPAPAPALAAAASEPPAQKPLIIASKLTRSVAPIYPDRCGGEAAALESVTVIFDVTDAGRPANARVISSTNACFEKSAVKTIKRWRFEPKTVNGAVQADAGKTATLHFRQ